MTTKKSSTKSAATRTTKRPQSPLRVGNKVFLRAVTHYLTGEVVLVTRDEILLRHAAWVADTGRWADALRTGNLSEVEPYPDDLLVGVGRGALVDYCDWTHDLPRVQR